LGVATHGRKLTAGFKILFFTFIAGISGAGAYYSMGLPLIVWIIKFLE